MYSIRLYNQNDCDDILGIFRSNMPQYFDPTELEPFQKFLSDIKGKYFVCEAGNKLVGAGGYYETEEGEARVCWIMVEKTLHRKGVGKFMMQEFEKAILLDKLSNRITLKTTQNTDYFYETLGYTTTKFERDFWVKGLHLYFMEKKI